MPKGGDIHIYCRFMLTPVLDCNGSHTSTCLEDLDESMLVAHKCECTGVKLPGVKPPECRLLGCCRMWTNGNSLAKRRPTSENDAPIHVQRQWHPVGIQEYKLPSDSDINRIVLLVYNLDHHILPLRECFLKTRSQQ
jgi:hypothetical protein